MEVCPWLCILGHPGLLPGKDIGRMQTLLLKTKGQTFRIEGDDIGYYRARRVPEVCFPLLYIKLHFY